MKKSVSRFLMIQFLFSCAASSVSAQTLLTYGNQSVGKQDFLKAYQKNNADKNPTEKSYRDYLELYIRYKLKVKAAYDLRSDTLPNQLVEMKNFRNQVVDSYIRDEASLNKLVNEAFARSQKDIHLAHVFIAVPKNALPADTLKLYQKVTAAYNDLKKGKTFDDVAATYSEDSAVKNNHGDIGYITVFSLPYEMETVAYNMQTGQYSIPFRSQAGYHIFKNLGERKAIGKIKAAQILFLFPPVADDSIKIKIKHRADSVYTLLANGANFTELAKKYSDDNLSFQTGGEIAAFGTGKYETAFETAAFDLSRDGEFSKPVLTGFGYHIIRRLGREPVATENNKETFETFKQKVIGNPRIENSRKTLLQKILREENFKRAIINENNLWSYTDSSLRHRPLLPLPGMDDKTVLFSIANKNITVKDWLAYLKAGKGLVMSKESKANEEVLDKYVQFVAFEYYRSHLEEYNKDFAYQLNEFKEGNLLFEIMQRKVWDKASTDSIGLKNYFESHKDRYWWESSADAVLFTSTNEKAAEYIKEKIQQQAISWRKIVDSSSASTQADSGRFELTQLPLPEDKKFTPGQFTTMSINQNDNTVTFAYIIKLYNERLPRNYNDARGFVINDYQIYLEDNWIAELKKKYPVKVDEAVFRSLLK